MAPQALFNVRTSLAVLGEVLNGTNNLRGVGVLVVVPRHDLNLIGVVVATLNFHDFFVIVHNFETTVTVLQHTVVVPKPACSYQNYTTFRRYFQVLSQFYVLELSYSLYFFLCTYIFMWLSVPLLGASGTRGFRRGVRPAQMRSSGWVMTGLYSALIGVLMDGIEWWVTSVFWRILFEAIEGILMCWLPLTASYPCCSLLFICSVSTLPVLSPALLLL